RSARPGRTRLRRARPARLGARGFHARPRRPPLAARGQHRAGHYQPLADAQVGRRARRVVRRSVLADPRNLRGGSGRMSAFLRIAAWVIAVALVALPVVAVLEGWIGADRWPLRTLRVAGTLERVDEQQLRAAVLPHARKGFFAIRLEDAQA